MTHFEYISVAVALILSLVVSRLLVGVSAATQPDRAYWVHLCWIGQSLLNAVVFWWAFWNTQFGEWTAVRFAWALLIPSLMYVKAQTLVGPTPDSIASFRDYFFQNRVRFFSISLLTGLAAALIPLIHGESFAIFLRLLPFSIWTIAIDATGLLVRSSRVHAVLSVIALLIAAATLFIIPTRTPQG